MKKHDLRSGRLGHLTNRGCAVWLVFLAALSPAWATPISIVTLDESRIGTLTNDNGSINWNLASGVGFGALRAELQDGDNFGPGGTVPRSITIESMSAFNSFGMGGADVIVLPALYDFAFADCEFCVIESFVRQGGGLLVFANSAASRFATMVGAGFANESNGSDGQTADATSPVLQGPFGNLDAPTAVPLGFNYLFQALPETGTPLIETASERIIGAAFSLDLGRVVLINDEELFFAGPSVNGLGAARLSEASTTLFLNAIAYLAPDEQFRYRPDLDCDCAPIPEPPTLALLGSVALLGAVWRRLGAGR